MPLIVGNWKMHGTRSSVAALADRIAVARSVDDGVSVAVCAPFVFIPMLAEHLNGTTVRYGAQNVADQQVGAYTGEVSAAMLREFGCHYAIVGHSERRTLYGETSGLVAARLDRALDNGLTPIFCVGESLEQRERGETEQVLTEQFAPVLAMVGIAAFRHAVIAYEPLWAIGTGRTATPELAQATHAFIRNHLARLDAGVARDVQLLYGGSVKPDNAAELFAQPDIDGGLIGGASLDADAFLAICNSGKR